MKRLSHALISIVLAALLLVTAVLPAFAGGERDPFIPQPMIGYFIPITTGAIPVNLHVFIGIPCMGRR